MNLYFQKKFRPVFALFFAVFAIALLLLNSPLLVRVNGFFILVVNGILFVLALINYLRLSKLDRNNPNALVRSMMSGTMIKFIVFGGAALWYALQKKAPIGTYNLLIAMGLYLWYSWIEIGWTKIKKDA
jgi:predicted ABC-type exoprotein transport system permease subunit